MKQTVSFISLGCAKNQVDCEQMMYLMAQAGWEIRPEPEDVDLVVVNTCGFIDAAKSEAIDHILAVGRKKAEGSVGRLLVTGCLAQRYQEEILTELPEVDGVLGTGAIISFNLEVLEDVVLDFTGLLDGACFIYDDKDKRHATDILYQDEHIIIPMESLIEGRNKIELSFFSKDPTI